MKKDNKYNENELPSSLFKIVISESNRLLGKKGVFLVLVLASIVPAIYFVSGKIDDYRKDRISSLVESILQEVIAHGNTEFGYLVQHEVDDQYKTTNQGSVRLSQSVSPNEKSVCILKFLREVTVDFISVSDRNNTKNNFVESTSTNIPLKEVYEIELIDFEKFKTDMDIIFRKEYVSWIRVGKNLALKIRAESYKKTWVNETHTMSEVLDLNDHYMTEASEIMLYFNDEKSAISTKTSLENLSSFCGA